MQQVPEKQDSVRKKPGPDILLGSGSVEPTILARIIQSFYGGSGVDDDDASGDRRRYRGKHQSQTMAASPKQKTDRKNNSPMFIRLGS
jgi:hypothetical protein